MAHATTVASATKAATVHGRRFHAGMCRRWPLIAVGSARKCFLLDDVVLGGSDRAVVEQVLRLTDLAGDVTVTVGRCGHVPAALDGRPFVRDAPVPHVVALRDQVDEDSDEGE